MEILNKSKLNFIKLLFIKNFIIYLYYMRLSMSQQNNHFSSDIVIDLREINLYDFLEAR